MSSRLAISSTTCAGRLHPIVRTCAGVLLTMALVTLSFAQTSSRATPATSATPATPHKPTVAKAAAPASSAQPADKPAQTRLNPDANGTVSTIRDVVVGDNSRGYVIAARKGQTLTVALKTSSTSLYMNVFAPQDETAVFNGSLADTPNLATVKVATDGDYRIDVYLFRASARRGSKAPFTLDVSVK